MRVLRNLFIILITGLMLYSCESQKKVSEVIYDKYNGKNGFSILVLPPNLVDKFIAKENTDQKELINTIQDFRIMFFDNEIEGKTSKTVLDEINILLDKRRFEEFMTVNKDGTKFMIKAKEKDGLIHEMHILVGGDDKLVMASLRGRIDMNKVSSTINEIDFDDFSGLKGLKGDLDFDDLKIKL